MKKLFFLSVICFVFSMCTTSKKTVGTDKALAADIKSYMTYDWVKNIDQIPKDKVFVSPNGVLVFNNESTRSNIKEAIRYELDTKGYEMSNENPDFYVSFIVLEQPGELTTYNGFQTVYSGLEEVRTQENIRKTPVKAGTVLINFIDADTNEQVWQGFASGILKPEMVYDQSKVRTAISSIFSKYNFRAGAES